MECKYCQDTQPDSQRQHAEEQHADLLTLLHQSALIDSASGEDIQILVGVGGTVYRDLISQLMKLGLDRVPATKLAETLHLHAVNQAFSIWGTRQHLIQKCGSKDSRTRTNK